MKIIVDKPTAAVGYIDRRAGMPTTISLNEDRTMAIKQDTIPENCTPEQIADTERSWAEEEASSQVCEA